MKKFECVCGNRVFFENTHCNNCGRLLGFDAATRRLLALEREQGAWCSPTSAADGSLRLCRNAVEHTACNWLIRRASAREYCLSCQLSRTIPNLASPHGLHRWQALESAKRRLIYSLLELDLPIVAKREDAERGLAFDFLEDQASNPTVLHQHVATGHAQGLITINVREADHAAREETRSQMNEPYRTLLGHFRHEIGHYYWERLVANSPWTQPFRERFGDERRDYTRAMQAYYERGPQADWRAEYISAYACAHPWEDWAETWAHYLHMTDTLETALSFGVVADAADDRNFQQWLDEWMQLTVVMNALNRSMGVQDAYPFVLSPAATDKLRFVHRVITVTAPANRVSAAPRRPA